MKQFIKKIISLTCLIIFLFGLFVPFNQIFAQTTPGTCPTGWTNSYPLCIGPPGAGVCPTGFDGTYPYCTVSRGTCPTGFTGTYPLCIGPAGAGICPTGFTGTYPYCVGPTCTSPQIPVNGVCKTPVPITPLNLNCTLPLVPNATKTDCVSPTTDTTYTLLAPLSGTGLADKIDTQKSDSNPCPLGNYLNIIIKIILGFSAVLAMVMIVIGGIEYMTSDLISSKEAGKETVTNAILGLLIALGAYLILNTINPQLLSVCLDKLPQATITINLGGESSQPFQAINQSTLRDNFGITLCNGTGGKSAVADIGKQFIPQTEYSQTARNTMNSSTLFVDCSSFVDQVYVCAGLANPGDNSNIIFSTGNSTKVTGATYDFTQLHSGDLVGWKPTDDKSGNGHVAIYLGNGQILDTQDTNNPTAIRQLSSIQNRITYVKWP